MAQRVLGVDLGAYSVKVAVLEASFRQATLVNFLERPVPPGEEPYLERSGRALAELVAAHQLGDAVAYAALPGDLVSLRLLELPFSDERKIEQVIGFELESQIPQSLDEVVVDHQVVVAGPRTKVLAAAAARESIRAVLGLLGAAGIPPRALYAAPLCYGALHARAFAGLPSPLAIVDCGHVRTNLCIVRDGRVVFGRTLSRGGAHLTRALARAFRLREEDAERGKHREGAIGSPAYPQSPQRALVEATLREALAPLVRDLKQSLAYVHAQLGEPVQQVLLCGGTARLPGLAEHLAGETGLAVGHLELPAADLARVREGEVARPVVPMALAVAAAGALGRHEIDFRKGEFGYKVDYSFLRAKSLHLAGCFLALLAFAALNTYAALTHLRREETALEKRLRTATVELFGKETSASEVSRQIRHTIKSGVAELPIPEETALDLLDDISRKVPGGEGKRLDVLELDIKPKKTFIKGTIESAAAVDEIVTALKTIRCFEDIQKGPIQNVVGQDLKQFTLTIAARCP